MRQLPLTHTDQCPAKSRESGCRRQPGMPMSSGPFEVSSLASCARNRFACAGWISALLPARKNASSRLCRNDLIVVRPYSVAIRLSMTDCVAGLGKSVAAIRRCPELQAGNGQVRNNGQAMITVSNSAGADSQYLVPCASWDCVTIISLNYGYLH